MPTNIVVPPLGESVTQATLLRWLKQSGDVVNKDEPLAEMETDKANVDLPSPASGVISFSKNPGDVAQVGEVIGSIDESAQPTASGGKPATASATQAKTASGNGKGQDGNAPASAASTATVAAPPPSHKNRLEDLSPAVRRMVEENNLSADAIPATGPNGRLTKEDVQGFLDGRGGNGAPADEPPAQMPEVPAAATSPGPTRQSAAPLPPSKFVQSADTGSFDADGIKRVQMSKIRKRIAENLVRAQQTAAILTTFNEVDLKNIMDLRAKYKDRFTEVHGIGLGLMSFFCRAVVLGLREFPRVNAFIDGDDVIYHNYVHLGIAVSTERGLAVPVLRNAETMSFAKVESEIKRLAAGTRDGKLQLQELSGGTFTITNGGVFGSLLSTPILNPPQSGILGMHTIQKRPVAVDDQIEIRPMMYLALSYDHRIVDGRESVSFLVRVKQYLEDPSRLMLEI